MNNKIFFLLLYIELFFYKNKTSCNSFLLFFSPKKPFFLSCNESSCSFSFCSRFIIRLTLRTLRQTYLVGFNQDSKKKFFRFWRRPLWLKISRPPMIINCRSINWISFFFFVCVTKIIPTRECVFFQVKFAWNQPSMQ